MRKAEQKHAIALGMATLAGIVAGGVVYLLYRKPEWRQHVFAGVRHLLGIAEGLVKRDS